MTTIPSRAACLFAASLLLALPPGGVNAGVGTTDGLATREAAIARDGMIDFAGIVERASLSVVAISTRQLAAPRLPAGMPEGLAERLREREALPRRESSAVGSGFFISADGHIVTNNHVVEGARSISVTVENGTIYPADVVGIDPLTDLAVLKIELPEDESENLVVASWGDSDALMPGAWTIAVGSPFGLGGTVTVGVLSARQRDIRSGPFDDFLQTDAAINVGNSGGPLFNAAGEVVGVNTAIFSPTGASVGIGFAVPSAIASNVVAQLIETGEVSRGFIGVSLQDLDAPLARAFGYAGGEGVLVGDVDPGGRADAAGLRRGDIVVRLGEAPMQSARTLARAIADAEPEAPIALRVVRGGAERSVEVTVARREAPRPEPLAAVEEVGREARLGLALRPVPDPMRRELGLDATGVIVQGVRPGGLGATGGLRRGDLILEAGEAPVEKPGDITSAWEEARQAERPLLLQIRRGGEGRYVAIDR